MSQRARSPTTYPHGSGRRQTHKRSKCPDSSSGKEERAPVGRRTGLFSKTESSSPSKLSTTKLPDTRPVLGWTLETLSDKNFELYEGEAAGLVFLLTHPGQESIVFCSENDNLAEKWMTALREATCLEG